MCSKCSPVTIYRIWKDHKRKDQPLKEGPAIKGNTTNERKACLQSHFFRRADTDMTYCYVKSLY